MLSPALVSSLFSSPGALVSTLRKWIPMPPPRYGVMRWPAVGKSTSTSSAMVKSLRSTCTVPASAPVLQYSAYGMTWTFFTNVPASTWPPRRSVPLASSGSTNPMRAPMPLKPRPTLLCGAACDGGGVDDWAHAADATPTPRPTARRQIRNGRGYDRAITEHLPGYTPHRDAPVPPSGPGSSRVKVTHEIFRRQLEPEAEASVDREPIHVHRLLDLGIEGGIEVVEVERAEVVRRLAVEAYRLRGHDVQAAHELGAEAGVVVAERNAVRVGSLDPKPLVAGAAADVGRELRSHGELEANDAHHGQEVGVDGLGLDRLLHDGSIGELIRRKDLLAIGAPVIPGDPAADVERRGHFAPDVEVRVEAVPRLSLGIEHSPADAHEPVRIGPVAVALLFVVVIGRPPADRVIRARAVRAMDREEIVPDQRGGRPTLLGRLGWSRCDGHDGRHGDGAESCSGTCEQTKNMTP